MKETDLYATLRPHLMAWGECDRVENSISSGMADVHYNIEGTLGWLETKLLKGGILYFEKFQPNWIAKHTRLGARVFVVAMDEKETIRFWPGKMIVKAPKTPYNKWITVNYEDLPAASVTMDKPYRSWRSVRELLIS